MEKSIICTKDSSNKTKRQIKKEENMDNKKIKIEQIEVKICNYNSRKIKTVLVEYHSAIRKRKGFPILKTTANVLTQTKKSIFTVIVSSQILLSKKEDVDIQVSHIKEEFEDEIKKIINRQIFVTALNIGIMDKKTETKFKQIENNWK